MNTPLFRSTPISLFLVVLAAILSLFAHEASASQKGVVLKFKGTVWVRIENRAGKALVTKEFKVGSNFAVPRKRGLTIIAKDGGLIAAYVDGKLCGLMGKDGEILANASLDRDRLPCASPKSETRPETESKADTGDDAENEFANDRASSDFSNLPWPVKGKIISDFGQKPDGKENEGINLAVPEGTNVVAVKDGVVAYAGNELKGYGNLILLRHDSGYVTAYAHMKELSCKRGDGIKRGDVLGLSGSTGAVSSPQLHFEVRKGATALDPMKFLSAQQ